MTTKQAREAVRAILPETISGSFTLNRRTTFYVHDTSDPDRSKWPLIGKGDTDHRAWLDALANLSKPRLYVEPAESGTPADVGAGR